MEKKLTSDSAPDHLTMNLFAPGMSAIHRTGLGGLACTLKAIEHHYKAGLLQEDKLPAPFVGETPPWTIDDCSVTLNFGKPENAASYLERLFEFAFQIRGGLIFLPGQYCSPPPSLAVRAELQLSLTRTFLQGAKKNIGLSPKVPYAVDATGCGDALLEIEFQQCSWYLHQNIWMTVVDHTTSCLRETPAKKAGGKNVNFGSLYPGAIKRHDAIAQSDLYETTPNLITLAFFLVGSLALRPTNSGDGILLIPEVSDLHTFVLDRPFMTPRSVAEVRIGGMSDAAYQMQLRILTRGFLLSVPLYSCTATTFSLRTWTKPQKSRTSSISLDTSEVRRVVPDIPIPAELMLERFECALAALPCGVRIRNDETTYWRTSVLRPFIANNLALGLPWHEGFAHRFKTPESRLKLSYERKGINTMVQNTQMYDNENQQMIIHAVHEAILSLRGDIRVVYQDRPTLKYKKFDDESEKWSRAIAGCMTLSQFRKTITDLFRRGGPNPELQKNWELLLPMLNPDRWEESRDLALIGFCSYLNADSVKSQRTSE